MIAVPDHFARTHARNPGALLVLAALLLCACGAPLPAARGLPPDEDVAVAVLSTDLAVGRARLALALRDRDGRPVAGGPLRLRLTPLDAPAALPLEAQAVPRPSGVPGVAVYAALVEFPRAGAWRVQVQAPSGRPEAPWHGAAVFEVHAAPATPAVGAPAPRASAPSLTAGAPLTSLTSLPQPDAALYQYDPAAVLSTGRPTVLTFAAPALCPTGECAAQVAVLSALRARFGERLAVRHVDPFPAGPSGGLPEIVRAWNLRTQPWTFVMDGSSRVAAKFEGYVGPEELEEAVDRVLNVN